MRINFAGSLLKLNPLVLVYEANDTFVKAAYVSAGYRNYEAIAIGAGGGRGGNYFGADWMDDSRTIHCYGGMGGGGGFHRIRGVLSALPSSVNVVIGGPGAQGTDRLIDSPVEYDISTTDGGDGGTSHFNHPACVASGGKGGKRVYTATLSVDPYSDGGDGGSGASSSAGGGGVGGIAQIVTTPPLPELPVNGGAGTLVGGVGKGGGGGAGGVGLMTTPVTVQRTPTIGGKGAYNASDQSVYDYGGPIGTDSGLLIVPGFGGGARTTPLTDSTKAYGRSGEQGVVVLRLTVD